MALLPAQNTAAGIFFHTCGKTIFYNIRTQPSVSLSCLLMAPFSVTERATIKLLPKHLTEWALSNGTS